MRRWSLGTMMIGLVAASVASIVAVWLWRDREERLREAARRVREKYEELVRLERHGRNDEALALAHRLMREAMACREGNIARSAERIQARLQPQYDEVARRLREARQLEERGDYAGACRVIDSLHVGYPFWRDARRATFPFSIRAEPPGVRIYKKVKLDGPWPKEPIATSTARADGTVEPLVLRLEFGHGRFALRFEREGLATQEVVVRDEREGHVTVQLTGR